MLGVLISIMVLAVVGLIPTLFIKDTYGSKLEEYITSHNPTSTYDVEKLTNEFNEKQNRGIL